MSLMVLSGEVLIAFRGWLTAGWVNGLPGSTNLCRRRRVISLGWLMPMMHAIGPLGGWVPCLGARDLVAKSVGAHDFDHNDLDDKFF